MNRIMRSYYESYYVKKKSRNSTLKNKDYLEISKKYDLEKNFLLIIICASSNRILSPLTFSCIIKNNGDILDGQVRRNTLYNK